MDTARSDWLRLTEGTSQGSVMGPFAYNAYTNDLIMRLSAMCDIFNYPDDNTCTACCYGDCTAEVIRGLEKVASDIITWFRLNEKKVNGNKFQLIFLIGN